MVEQLWAAESSAFNSTIGAMFIGFSLSTVLAGTSFAQALSYFTQFRKDHVALKSFVATTCLLDVLHTMALSHALYTSVVLGRGDPASLQIAPWTIPISVLLTTLIDSFHARTFFCYRIWRLRGGTRMVLAACLIVSAMSLVIFGLSIYLVVKLVASSEYSALDDYKWEVFLCFGLQIGGDAIVAIYTVYIISKQKQFTLMSGTIQMLNNIMLFSLNTGCITVSAALLTFVLYGTLPSNNLTFLAIYMILSKLYVNSLLASLNARSHLRKKLNAEVNLGDLQSAMPEGASVSVRDHNVLHDVDRGQVLELSDLRGVAL